MPTDYFIARIVCVCLLVIVLLPVLAIGLFNFWLWWRFHRAEREAQRVLDGRVAQLGRAFTGKLADGTLTYEGIAVAAYHSHADGLSIHNRPDELIIKTKQGIVLAGPWVGGTGRSGCFSYDFTKPLAPGRRPQITRLGSCSADINFDTLNKHLPEYLRPAP